MTHTQFAQSELLRLAATRFILAIVVVFAILFLPAGTLVYWEAWVWLGVLFIPVLFTGTYLYRNNPELLERRMRTREKQAEQKRIVWLSSLYLLVVFLLPGLDHRFSWSDVPAPGVILADLLVLAGYGFLFLVFKENRYASRVIEVEKEQQVVTTGVYALVRHPMYLGVCLMYIFSPLALGSYWATAPALLIIPLLMARIRNEEIVLARELKGYPDYMKQTKYRLIPGIW